MTTIYEARSVGKARRRAARRRRLATIVSALATTALLSGSVISMYDSGVDIIGQALPLAGTALGGFSMAVLVAVLAGPLDR